MVLLRAVRLAAVTQESGGGLSERWASEHELDPDANSFTDEPDDVAEATVSAMCTCR